MAIFRESIHEGFSVRSNKPLRGVLATIKKWLARVLQRDSFQIGGIFHVYCFSADTDISTVMIHGDSVTWTGPGTLKWEDKAFNKIPNVELDHVLSTEFAAGTAITAWYVGLTESSPTPAATDTMSSHSGWTEETAYSQSTRPAWTVTEGSQTATNSASPATFTINASSQTVGGAFITSNNTIGGTSGNLAAVSAFSGGNRSPDSGDEILVTYSISASSST